MNVKTNRNIVIILVLLLFTLFLGYTYYVDADTLQHISAEVSSIQQVYVTIPATTITFTLNISNPGQRSINQLSSTFDLYIEQNYLGSGSFHDLTIPPQSSQFTQVTMSLDNSEIAASVVDMLSNLRFSQNTTVKVEGTMTASVLFGMATASHQYIAKNT